MNLEETKPTDASQAGAVPIENMNGGANPHAVPADNRTPVARATEAAREQASEAANAFRRGEFMREATVDAGANADDRLIGMLAYVIPVLLPIIVLLSESGNKRPFQRYHAVQSLSLSVLFVVFGVAVSIGTGILQIIPPIGLLVGLMVLCLTPIVLLMAVIAMLYYGYQAYAGKRFAIPGVTNFLINQGWL